MLLRFGRGCPNETRNDEKVFIYFERTQKNYLEENLMGDLFESEIIAI